MSPQRAAVRQKGRAEEKTSSFFFVSSCTGKKSFSKTSYIIAGYKSDEEKKGTFFWGGIKTRNQNSFSSNTNSNTSNGSEKNKVLFFLYMSFWLLGS